MEFQKVLNKRKEQDLDASWDDVLAVAQGKILVDGKAIPLDEKWIKEHKTGFKLLMKLWESDQVKLDAAYKEALENLDGITDSLMQIKRLRRSWGSSKDYAAQLDRLTALVMELTRRRNEND